MKAYLIVTGVLFALVALAHVLRIAAENPALALDPVFAGLTLLAAALAVWAFRLLWRTRR